MMDDYNLEIQRELDAHERIMVGVNKFVPDEEHAPTRFTFDPTNTRMHIRRFAELKQQRDAGPWSQSLRTRSEEHTSELQSLMRISYAVFCLKKKHMKTT